MHEQAVILAGGKGTRLMPLTKDVPKPMVRVAGQPFLYWQLSYLRGQGVRNVLLLVSHLAHVIQDHFAKNPVPGLELAYAVEKEPMGTGGAIKNALPQLEEAFWLLNGDSFLPADLKAMHAYTAGRGWLACLAVLEDKGLVPVPANLRLRGDVVSGYQKGAGRDNGFTDIDAGVYWLSRTVIENAPGLRFDLEACWPAVMSQMKLGTYRVNERFFDIGTPERLRNFEEHVHDYF